MSSFVHQRSHFLGVVNVWDFISLKNVFRRVEFEAFDFESLVTFIKDFCLGLLLQRLDGFTDGQINEVHVRHNNHNEDHPAVPVVDLHVRKQSHKVHHEQTKTAGCSKPKLAGRDCELTHNFWAASKLESRNQSEGELHALEDVQPVVKVSERAGGQENHDQGWTDGNSTRDGHALPHW